MIVFRKAVKFNFSLKNFHWLKENKTIFKSFDVQFIFTQTLLILFLYIFNCLSLNKGLKFISHFLLHSEPFSVNIFKFPTHNKDKWTLL
jgi:hypothetical protein